MGWRKSSQVSQIAWSQQGRRKALTASLLQTAHLSFMGISSRLRELQIELADVATFLGGGKYLINSAWAAVPVVEVAISMIDVQR